MVPSKHANLGTLPPTHEREGDPQLQVGLPLQTQTQRTGRAVPGGAEPLGAAGPAQARPRPLLRCGPARPQPGSSGRGAVAMAAAGPPLLVLLLQLLLLLPRPPAALRLLLDAAPPFTCSQPVREPGWGGRQRPPRRRARAVSLSLFRGSRGPRDSVAVPGTLSRSPGLCRGPRGSVAVPGFCRGPQGCVAVPGSAASSERAVLEAAASARAGCESLLRADVAQCSKSFNQFFAAEGFLGELSIVCTRGF